MTKPAVPPLAASRAWMASKMEGSQEVEWPPGQKAPSAAAGAAGAAGAASRSARERARMGPKPATGQIIFNWRVSEA